MPMSCEITTKTELDYEKFVPGVTAQIGFDISDAVLDAGLKKDPMSKVGYETASKDNLVMVMGEFTTKTELALRRLSKASCLRSDTLWRENCLGASPVQTSSISSSLSASWSLSYQYP